MPSKFVKDLLIELNKWRLNPQSIAKQCDLVKKGISRFNPKDPFIGEIDAFIASIPKLPEMNELELNTELTKAAEIQVQEFVKNEKYNRYQKGYALRKVVPEGYLKQDPGLVADDGADGPETVASKILLNKLDKGKVGRELLSNPEYTQVGLAQQKVGDDNFVVIILANKKVVSELPEGDLTELKQAFDLFDKDGSRTIRIEEVMKAMRSMKFDDTNPVLYEILHELTDNEIVSWPQFACHVVKRISDRKTEDGLRTIFELFIDNPKASTISVDTFKKICKEIGESLTDEELRHIIANTTENGMEISFSDFCQYMKLE